MCNRVHSVCKACGTRLFECEICGTLFQELEKIKWRVVINAELGSLEP